ncbi:hypothetical protein [Limosilactobacillus reuteri]|uniref:Uncharacterized protein n=1 Tax=Limosilactobacillus reuteri TaxID=1598 RepID=A0A256SM86_LIMRT|nr:hypothetical protein [Limosilactobacillus reuteri]OYS67816.1 hypothetical protein CBF96_08675 [Limosilactobacillus reuteri]
MDNLRQKIKQFASDFSHFSEMGKAATIVITMLALVGAYLFIIKFAFWLILLAIVAVLIGLYFIEHTNQLWRANDARKAVTAVIDGLTRKGFITRNIFKLDSLNMPSETLRTFNRAVYEFELAKNEVAIDIVQNEDVLTFESQQSWQRYLLDNSERSSFAVQRVALIDRDSHYLLRIIFRDKKHCQLLDRNEVYNKQLTDRDF